MSAFSTFLGGMKHAYVRKMRERARWNAWRFARRTPLPSSAT
jgi:hypothetical protein